MKTFLIPILIVCWFADIYAQKNMPLTVNEKYTFFHVNGLEYTGELVESNDKSYVIIKDEKRYILATDDIKKIKPFINKSDTTFVEVNKISPYKLRIDFNMGTGGMKSSFVSSYYKNKSSETNEFGTMSLSFYNQMNKNIQAGLEIGTCSMFHRVHYSIDDQTTSGTVFHDQRYISLSAYWSGDRRSLFHFGIGMAYLRNINPTFSGSYTISTPNKPDINGIIDFRRYSMTKSSYAAYIGMKFSPRIFKNMGIVADLKYQFNNLLSLDGTQRGISYRGIIVQLGGSLYL